MMALRRIIAAITLCTSGVTHAGECSAPANAASVLNAIALRSDAVSRLQPGTGVGVQLAPGPCGGLVVRGADGAGGADLTWARHIVDANRLSEALGATPLEASLTVHNFPGQVGAVLADGSSVAGPDPNAVLATFFKRRLKESSTLSFETLDQIIEAPDAWAELVDHLRAETVDTVEIIVGSQRAIALPEGAITHVDTLQIVGGSSGVDGVLVKQEDGSFQMKLQTSETVSPGTHHVYFYSGDSRFEPVASMQVNVIEPKRTK